MRPIVAVFLFGWLMGCGSAPPDGYLEPCSLPEDCRTPGMECAKVQNNFTGLLTDQYLCTLTCQTNQECPTLDCDLWEGTDLECPQTAAEGGRCGRGAIGSTRLMVCGM